MRQHLLMLAVCSLVKVINLIIARPDPEFRLASTHRDTWKDRYLLQPPNHLGLASFSADGGTKNCLLSRLSILNMRRRILAAASPYSSHPWWKYKKMLLAGNICLPNSCVPTRIVNLACAATCGCRERHRS